MRLQELFEVKTINYKDASINDRNAYDSYFYYKDNPEYDKFSVVIGNRKWLDFPTAKEAQETADKYNRRHSPRTEWASAKVKQNY